MARGHHLAQGLEARGPVILIFVHPDAAADLEGLVTQAMTVLEKEQRLAVEVLDPHALAVRECMVRGYGEREGFFIQRGRLETVDGGRQGEDAEIEFSGAQLLEQGRRLVLVEQQPESRQRAPQSPRDMRQQVRPDRWNQGELERAGERVAIGFRKFDDRVRFLQQPARAFDDLSARGRERHAPRLSLDEGDAQVLLELAHLRGQRRLADETALGSPAEVPLVRQCHEVAQVAEVHWCIIAAAYRKTQLRRQSAGSSFPYTAPMTPRSPRISAGVVVVRHAGEGWLFLLLRAFNHWDFPKGMVEQDESPLAAAIREVREESLIEDLEFAWGEASTQTGPYSRGKVARYFVARTRTAGVSLPVNPDLGRPEHSEYRWVDFDGAIELVSPRVRPVVEWAARVINLDADRT